MRQPDLNPQWLEALHARAVTAPLRPRLPLRAGDAVIGSVDPDVIRQIQAFPLYNGRNVLLKEERSGFEGWQLAGDATGDLTARLNQLAEILRDAGLAGAWRQEQLAVLDDSGRHRGTIERAAVRTLGITTHAVHLVGQTQNGGYWVQQRALDKPNDPGLWDTLMGGTVSAADTLHTALARETWEEAGLLLQDLHGVEHGGRVSVRRPSTDGAETGIGYLVEDTDWFRCTVPEGRVPVNQDGEVLQFRQLSRDELHTWLQRNAFTLEAALVLVAALGL